MKEETLILFSIDLIKTVTPVERRRDLSPNVIFNVVYTLQNLIWGPFSLEAAHKQATYLERTFAITLYEDTNNFLVTAVLTSIF